ncbi:unnamed protein product [Phytomonas sp. Hart1]|nr:unnamed protein product [Phytomonas sp. Hart1]|eukprot:CCW68302.1 unnamed protein product [Phytomonas sp. isolate Hart1]
MNDNDKQQVAHPDAQYWINHLKLQPHPEGGFFREVTLSNYVVTNQIGKHRFAYTSIYFLLTDKSPSHFHRLPSDEVWAWHAGDPLDVHVIYRNDDDDDLISACEGKAAGEVPRLDPEHFHANSSLTPPHVQIRKEEACTQEKPEKTYQQYHCVKVGPNADQDERFQYTVPAGTIFGSTLADGGKAGYTLLSCIVSPGFDYRDYELFTQEQLMSMCPQHEGIIQKLAYKTLPLI